MLGDVHHTNEMDSTNNKIMYCSLLTNLRSHVNLTVWINPDFYSNGLEEFYFPSGREGRRISSFTCIMACIIIYLQMAIGANTFILLFLPNFMWLLM